MDKKPKDRKEPKRVVSCGAVTWRKNGGTPEVLLIKQFINDDLWGMPKGHTNEGESVEQCAVREVKEETGVDIVLLQRLNDCFSLSWKKHKTVVSFLAAPAMGGSMTPVHDGEHSEVADARWFTLDQVKQLKLINYQAVVIEQAIAMIKEEVGFTESLKK